MSKRNNSKNRNNKTHSIRQDLFFLANDRKGDKIIVLDGVLPYMDSTNEGWNKMENLQSVDMDESQKIIIWLQKVRNG